MTQTKKAIFFLIDALRFDTLASPAARKYLFPNLSKLADRGFVRRVVTNAQSTQFVVPSIFSLTYPLDYGGYNNGIRDRPKSFAECLRDAGFETHLMANCNQLGVATGYARGFDTVCSTSDFRVLLEQRIGRMLRYEVELWQKGERSEAEAIEIIQREFGLSLTELENVIRNHDTTIWPAPLRRINFRIARGCAAEYRLLQEKPGVVLRKLLKVAPGNYWRFLGVADPPRLKHLWIRFWSAISWRSRTWIAAQTLWPFFHLSHYPVYMGQIIDPLCKLVASLKSNHWFMHFHVMDVHDCRSINHPLQMLLRLRFLPRWIIGRLTGRTRRRWLYDTTLMYVDHLLGRLMRTLEKTGQLDDTVILVTGDHALQYAESPRKKYAVGYRTFYEDIEVPLLLANTGRQPKDQGMIDSMGVSATLLDVLGVPLHQSFKGVSAFGDGRPFVVSENCGVGNADLKRRDIYFTLTTPTHKIMSILRGKELHVEHLYDLRDDPRELRNLVSDAAQRSVIEHLVGLLRLERAELFTAREAAESPLNLDFSGHPRDDVHTVNGGAAAGYRPLTH